MAHGSTKASIGLLLLRLGPCSFLIYGHGWGKLANYTARSETFSDPLGVGSPMSLGLAVFAEVFCSIAVMLGLLTRLAAIPLIITMGVAGFIRHAPDPFAKKELALLYLIVFVTIALTGAGRYSLDAKFGHLWTRKRVH